MTRTIAFFLSLSISVTAHSAETESGTHPINERAKQLLENLPGRWTFTLGRNTSGVRVIETLYEEMVVRWSESYDGRDVLGDGFIGWDSKRSEFFSMGVHNHPGEYGHMIGQLSDIKNVISWQPVNNKSDSPPFRSELEVLDENNFTSTAFVKNEEGEWEARWTAHFKRESP